MLSELASWYGRQMAGLLPQRLRARGDGPPDALIVAVPTLLAMSSAVELLSRRQRRETSLGRFLLDAVDGVAMRKAVAAQRPAASVLRLPPGTFLERTITLPLAAESGLENVVAFEMDRYTPFTADQVHWAVAVRSRDRAQGRLQAVMSVVQKSRVANVLAALREVGFNPGALEADGPGGSLRRIGLGGHDSRRIARQRRVTALAWGICAALALAAVAVPFLDQGRAADAVEQRIAELQPLVAQAEVLRHRLAARAAGSDAVAGQQALVGDALQAISALTQILPDNTFLTTLVLHQRRLDIDGQSANAAQLIASLSSDPIIRNAAFSAPVTRSENGVDLFSIRAEVRP